MSLSSDLVGAELDQFEDCIKLQLQGLSSTLECHGAGGYGSGCGYVVLLWIKASTWVPVVIDVNVVVVVYGCVDVHGLVVLYMMLSRLMMLLYQCGLLL